MLIYFVRHAESEGNKGGYHHLPETPLTDTGIKQAKVLAKRLRNLHFDLIYTSTHLRAKLTADIINEELKVPVEYWEDLVEMKTPTEIRGKKIEDEEVEKIKKIIRDKASTGDFRYSDEETPNEMIKRIDKVLKHLETKHGNQTVLCVSHCTAIKTVVARIIFGDELTPDIFLKVKHHLFAQNTGITICEKSDKYGWTVNTWNDMSHV